MISPCYFGPPVLGDPVCMHIKFTVDSIPLTESCIYLIERHIMFHVNNNTGVSKSLEIKYRIRGS
jgi:hypothetical protein